MNVIPGGVDSSCAGDKISVELDDRSASQRLNGDTFYISAGIITFNSSSSNVGGPTTGLGDILMHGFTQFTPTTLAFGKFYY